MSDTDLTWLFQILISFSFGFITAWLIAGWIFLPRRRRPHTELYPVDPQTGLRIYNPEGQKVTDIKDLR